MEKYDYLIVGAGIYGSVCARELTDKGYKVLVLEKRNHIGGNAYTEKINGISVHKYGPHIFHTNNKVVWDYVNRFALFNRFTNSPVAYYKGKLYALPFNMYTFNQMWGVITPTEAAKIINEQKKEVNHKPTNLEEQAISQVGRDIYEKLIKGYSEKQWGRSCEKLPASIIKRLPVRFTYDNNYFDDLYQGIPIGGYTRMIERLLDGINIKLDTDYLKQKQYYDLLSDHVIYTGPIDAYYDYRFGSLEYRTVKFDIEKLEDNNYQGNAVVNYTDIETPYTRIIEHKWFEFGKDENGKDINMTVISREYPSEWKKGEDPFYPVNDVKNAEIYEKYRQLAENDEKIIFGGRLAEYKYYDMDKTIEKALKTIRDVVNH